MFEHRTSLIVNQQNKIFPCFLNIKNMSKVESKNELSSEQREELLRVLKTRFEKNMNRHKGLEWANVQSKLEVDTKKLLSLNEMEENRW